jgi:hypothetical protein
MMRTKLGTKRDRTWLGRSLSRQGMTLVLAALVVATGCSSSWPRVTAVSDARFNSWAPPATIDVLPVDLEVWAHPDLQTNPEKVRLGAESSIVGSVTEQLFQRGYAIGAVLDWRGQFVSAGGQMAEAYEASQLLDTVDALSSYGTAMVVTPKEMPPPYLPVRLGERTGSEATLYVGGWGFIGKSSSTGANIAKGVLIAVAIIGIVVIVAALAKSDSGGKLVEGAAKSAGTAAKAAASAGRVALRAAARAGTAVIDIASAGTSHTGDLINTVAEIARISAEVHVTSGPRADCFGRTETHLNLVHGRPEWASAPGAKHSGGSAMYLEMTLVDNRTGLVRWHAHQQFPANPKNGGNIQRAVRAMLASMPAR